MTLKESRGKPSSDTLRRVPRPALREPSLRSPIGPPAFRSRELPSRGAGKSASNSALGASSSMRANAGKVRPALLLWALGVPLPLVLIVVLLRGC
jgi:hypothetical protein